jgi:transposase-like protein
VEKETHNLEPSDLNTAQAELKRLRRQLAAVSEERDILKKAIAIFSKEERNGTGS